MAEVRSAKSKLALVNVALVALAPFSRARVITLKASLALFNAALDKLALMKLTARTLGLEIVPDKLARVKSAESKIALVTTADDKVARDRFEPRKLVLIRVAPVKLTPNRLISALLQYVQLIPGPGGDSHALFGASGAM